MLVHVTYPKPSGKDTTKPYFSTDIEMDPKDVLQYYQSRFQIEFLYRDAKQHTGLNDCQARSENKLHFQFNASLTSINIAKAIDWLSIAKEKRGAFSMSDIKTMNHNILMINRFIDVFGICPYSIKNQNYVKELILYCTMAAYYLTNYCFCSLMEIVCQTEIAFELGYLKKDIFENISKKAKKLSVMSNYI